LREVEGRRLKVKGVEAWMEKSEKGEHLMVSI
jgi:hypothetical protein